jgi:predicted MPP superfamily phosphohydrolase
MESVETSSTRDEVTRLLEDRLGRLHLRQRLSIEAEHEQKALGQGFNFFHGEKWFSLRSMIRAALRVTGLYGRGQRNARDVRVRHNRLHFRRLPVEFDGFTVLHISDLHADLSKEAMDRVIELLPSLTYDVCVFTGDFRGKTFGPFMPAIRVIERIRVHLRGPTYGVLGNHDTIRMVLPLEAMGIRMLLNECVTLERAGAQIHMAGVDDAHFFQLHNIEKAGDPVPEGAFAVLLSHTPEIFRQAAHAGFDLMLSGHTHGGQICLPSGISMTLDADVPRRFGAGGWVYHGMAGYTSTGAGSSIVPVRLNCPPEITLHHLIKSPDVDPLRGLFGTQPIAD